MMAGVVAGGWRSWTAVAGCRSVVGGDRMLVGGAGLPGCRSAFWRLTRGCASAKRCGIRGLALLPARGACIGTGMGVGIPIAMGRGRWPHITISPIGVGAHPPNFTVRERLTVKPVSAGSADRGVALEVCSCEQWDSYASLTRPPQHTHTHTHTLAPHTQSPHKPHTAQTHAITNRKYWQNPSAFLAPIPPCLFP